MQNIEEIFNQYYSPLCNYAMKFVKNRAEAEDIVQELFFQLWKDKKLSKIDSHEKFLLKSVKFKCIDHIRKDKINLVTTDNLFITTADELNFGEEDIEPLLHYFASKLPVKTREIFLLSRNSKLSYKEIAEELNISVKTVEAHISKALKSMRKLLKKHDFYFLITYFIGI